MTNKEWLCSLSADQMYNAWQWITKVWGKGWDNTALAVIEWLDAEYSKTIPKHAYGFKEEHDRIKMIEEGA